MRKLLALLPIAVLAFAAGQMAMIQPADLAAKLSAKPAIFMVGPNVMYRNKHIPGAVFAGPGMHPAGIEMLKQAVAKLPRDKEIYIYCGCCPWDHCPNMQPAFEALKSMGFTKAKGVYMADNFKTNWLDKGYPFE